MQDYPKLLLQASKEQQNINTTCLVVTFPRFMAWSPVKNDYNRAKALFDKTGYEESPRSGEHDILDLFKQQLLSVNSCPVCNHDHKQRIQIEEGAFICLYPEAGITVEEIHKHIGMNVVIKKNSVVIIKSRNWFLQNCEIDGCLIIQHEDEENDQSGMVMINNCKIQNKSWSYYPIDKDNEDIDIVYRMRGYMVNREESLVINVKSNGNNLLENRDFTEGGIVSL